MPDLNQTTPLHSLCPIDDASAAASATAETHAELVSVILSTQAPRPARTPRWAPRHSRRPAVLAAGLATIVAALLVATPGLLAGGSSATQPQAADAAILHRIAAALARRPGTIVIEQQVTQLTIRANGKPTQRDSLTTTLFTQTSRRGNQLRQLSFSSDEKPGYQEATAGNLLEIFDPRDQTIYTTTPKAWEHAVSRRAAGGGSAFFQLGLGYSPGRTSVFEQELRRHLYKVAGRTTIDGRPALELVAAHRHEIRMDPNSGSYQILGTVYVAPGTYYPIKEVVSLPAFGHVTQTSVTSWTLYRVLTATRANRWMSSLTLRHPRARVVRSAEAYLNASRQMAVARGTRRHSGPRAP